MCCSRSSSSIKYVGVDIDKVDTYVRSSKIKLAAGGGGTEKTGHDVTAAHPQQPLVPPGRIIIHSRRPAAGEANHQVTLMQVRSKRQKRLHSKLSYKIAVSSVDWYYTSTNIPTWQMHRNFAIT